MVIRLIEIPDITKEDPALFVNNINDIASTQELLHSLPKLSAIRLVGQYSTELRDKDKVWELISRAAFLVIGLESVRNLMSAWLFVAHGAWQADSRIVRYNKLWKQLEKEYKLWTNDKSNDIEMQVESGIRYALSCRLNKDNFVAGARVLQNRLSAIIISDRYDMTSEQTVRRFFSVGFPLRNGIPHHLINWAALVSVYCQDGDIVVGPVGGFDDRELSLYIIGLPNRLALLAPREYTGQRNMVEQRTGRRPQREYDPLSGG